MDLQKIPILVLILGLGLSYTMAEDDDLKQLFLQQNNKFTGKMLSTYINYVEPDASVFLSPFAVLSPLCLLTFGSEGSTHEELLRATGLRNDYATMYIFSQIVNKMKTHSEEFKLANKVYVNGKYELNDNFDVISRDIFKGVVENIHFVHNKKSAAAINDWVSFESKNLTRNFISPSTLNADTSVLLINVLYYKGKWKLPFSEWKTKQKPFHVKKNKSKNVPMMQNTAEYNFLQSHKLDAKIIDMSYVGNETSMVIVLPNEIDGIKSLIKKLEDLNVLYQEMKNLTKQMIDVAIPKFVMKSTINLKKVLQKMHIREIFDSKAKLHKLIKTPQQLEVSEAIQKAIIIVDEEGAAVAASSDMEVEILATRRSRSSIIADHPFAFFLMKKDIVIASGVYKGPE